MTVATHTDEGGFLVIAPEPWMDGASCATTDADLFFPEGKGVQASLARKICLTCPVMDQCAEYAIRTRQRVGVWGGMSQSTLRRRVADAGRDAA